MAKQFSWDKEEFLETVVVDEKNKYDMVLTELKGHRYLQYVPYFMSREGWKRGKTKSLRLDVLDIFINAKDKHITSCLRDE